MAEDKPRFRRDLLATPLEAEGIHYVETRDPRSGSTFRFYDFEHAVAEVMDGRALAELAADASARSGLELTVEQLTAFTARLADLGFLDGAPDGVSLGASVGASAATVGSPGEASPTREVPLLDEGASKGLPVQPHPAPEPAPAAALSQDARDRDRSISLSANGDLDHQMGSEPGTSTSAERAKLIAETAVDRDAPLPTAEDLEPTRANARIPMSDLGSAAVPPLAVAPTPAAERQGDSLTPHLVTEAARPALVGVPGGSDTPAPAPAFPTPDPHEEKKKRRSSPLLFALLGVAIAIAIGFALLKMSASSQPPPVPVRTIVPSLGSIYRWFQAPGAVEPGGERTLAFPATGKVVAMMDAGTAFQVGDIVAELEAGKPVKNQLSHLRERLAYYEQMFETMRAASNRPEARQAEIKIAEKKRLIANAQAALAKVAVVAQVAGEVATPAVPVGAVVKSGDPAVKIKGTQWRATFDLPKEEADLVRHLGFCRAEIDGKPLDCSLSADGGDETHVLVDLPAEPVVATGKKVRLARARYDGVFVLPASALAPTRGGDKRVYVVKDGVAEPYAVVIADASGGEVVIKQGLEPGSAVVVDVPSQLHPRARVRVVSN